MIDSIFRMSSSESPEDELRPAEDPPHLRKRKTSKIILDALGVSCQVAPSTAGEVALLNPVAAEIDPAVAANVVAETEVAVTIASPTTNGPAVGSPGYSQPLDFLRKFLILALCPFLYGAATRLPFIYFVIHLDADFGDQITETFGSKWFPIGCFVAAYQVS